MSSQIAGMADLFGGPIKRRFKTLEPLPVKRVCCRIRSLTERELSDYQAEVIAKKGDGLREDKLKDANRRLISLCLVDGDGNTFINEEMRNEMANWDAADTTYLYDECAKFVGIKQGHIEDLVKNSETIPVVKERLT